MSGLRHGFSVGFNKEKLFDEERISGVTRYIPMNSVQKEAISKWILKGVKKEYISGPFDLDYQFPFGKLFLAPLFVIPKPDGRWRAIVNMSFKLAPHMYTINELLHEYMKTVQYVRFKEVVRLVKNAGKGAWLFLIDAQDAYYRVPIQAADWKYMGIKWANKYWVFRSLQMGLSSSPGIYTAFADAVEYACVNKNKDIAFLNGIQQLRHYIDDFFGALPKEEDAKTLYKSLFKVFKDLGIPTQWEKCTSPRQRARILGWIYSTLLQMVLLPDDKRDLLLSLIRKVLATKQGTVKLFRQLIGRLQHASTVVFPGKVFIRRLEALLHLPRFKDGDSFTVGTFVLQHLKWWEKILTSNTPCGMSFDLLLKHPSDSEIVIYTDACTEIGGGGFIMGLGNTIYFQIKWADTNFTVVEKSRELDIAILELLMSVAAVFLIKDKIHDKTITLYNDNPGAANSLSSKAPPLNRLDLQAMIEELATLAYEQKFYWWGVHEIVKNSQNMRIADRLSRFEPLIWSNGAYQLDIKDQCNYLFDILLKTPRNLVKFKDLSQDIRRAYGILFESPPRIIKPKPTEHNILKTYL